MPTIPHRRSLCLAILLSALGAMTALAQTPDVRIEIRFSLDFETCMKAADGKTMEMIDCMGQENARWDQRLNKAFRAVGKDVSEHVRAELRDAQRAWIAYREKACLAAGDVEAEGGSLARITANDCFLRMTAQRAAELEAMASPGR